MVDIFAGMADILLRGGGGGGSEETSRRLVAMGCVGG